MITQIEIPPINKRHSKSDKIISNFNNSGKKPLQKRKRKSKQKNISYNFEIDLKDNNENTLNEDILENWKKVLLAEENILEFKYEFIDENKINCNIKADKAKENRKFENIKKFM